MNRKFISCFSMLIFCLALAAGRAQTIGDWFYPNPNASVDAISQQSNGRLVIGGDFTKIGATDKGYIARLHIDGSLDTSFSALADNPVIALARQSNDKIIVGGAFLHMNGVARQCLARLESDGTLDSTFNSSAGGGPEAYVHALAIQSDGKILVGGNFATLVGATRHRIGRLNADGSLDSAFSADVDTGLVVYSVAIQSDGKIIIAGLFTSVNGQARSNIARLNTDGSLDTSFNPNAKNGNVHAVLIQPDGKIIVAGDFTEICGAACHRIVRLNTDGSIDPAFNPGTGADQAISCALLQADGKLVLGGQFAQFNGSPYAACVRLNSNGGVDTAFATGAGFDGEVFCLYQQADDKLVAGGNFASYDTTAYQNLVRLYPAEAKLDLPWLFPIDDYIYAMAAQCNERVLIGGDFTTIDGTDHRKYIGRLSPSWNVVDAAFTASADGGINGVQAIIVQPDDKIIIGGSFLTVNGAAHHYLARLLSDGTIDPAFTPGVINGSGIGALALQPDGKIIIGGDFTTIDGASYKRIARLNTNGVVDVSFNPGEGVDVGLVTSVALQPDGKVIVGGSFISLGGQTRNYIGRLNADGSLDTNFNPDMNDMVMCIAVQPDGKILVGGNFTTVAGDEHNHIARLDASGAADAAFNLPQGASSSVRSIAIQCDGKILISGVFTAAGGDNTHKYIARLNSDGSLDSSFAFGSHPSAAIDGVMLQKDGKIICGGGFANWYLFWSHLARIATTNAAMQSLSVSPMGDSITWLRSGASPELTRCLFEYSPNGAAWSELGDGARISGGWQIEGLDLPLNTNFYVRAVGLYCGGYCNASVSILDTIRLVYLTTPRVVITNVSGVVTGYYGAVNYALAGTNNVNVTGTMWWTNSLGGSAAFAAATPWSITVTGLSVGANIITICGSNLVGDVGTDSITIVQRRNDYLAADFDGDHWADPAGCDGTNWNEWLSTLNYNRISHAYGIAETFPAAADFDGDAYADPAVYNNQTGKWYLWLSTYLYWQVGPLPFGVAGAAPVPADFDGDRKADFAAYAAGSWYVWLSTANYQGFGPINFGPINSGLPETIPAAGDFDGDRLADPVIYWKGFWYAWLSSINYIGVGPVACGEAEAFPVTVDFDSDGICDLATVNRSAVWYAWLSTAGYQRIGPLTFSAEGWTFLPDCQ